MSQNSELPPIQEEPLDLSMSKVVAVIKRTYYRNLPFTVEQLAGLKREFKLNPNLNRFKKLAKQLNLSTTRVRKWFWYRQTRASRAPEQAEDNLPQVQPQQQINAKSTHEYEHN